MLGTYKLGKHPKTGPRKAYSFELENWPTLKLRHNLDVTHIEKNICEGLVGTCLKQD